MFCALLCMESAPEVTETNTQLNPIYRILMDITATLQNLAGQSSKLSPEKPVIPTPGHGTVLETTVSQNLETEGFLQWDAENYSVIQVHVLDQFLTTGQFASHQACIIKNINKLSQLAVINLEQNKASIDSTLTPQCSCNSPELNSLQKTLDQKIQANEISSTLNIGGGEESCGYQAIKNAILLSQNLDGSVLYANLNDPIYANNLFGTAAINRLLNIKSAENGPWRDIVIKHRIALTTSSISSNVNSMQKILTIIEADLKRLPKLVEDFQKSPKENHEAGSEIQVIWKNIVYQDTKASDQMEEAKQKSKDIDTTETKHLIVAAEELAFKIKDAVLEAKRIIPTEALKSTIERTKKDVSRSKEEEDTNYYDPDDYGIDSDDDQYDYDDEHENDEELQSSDKENRAEQKLIESDSFNLEQSEKEGNNLDVADLDYLYEILQESYKLPESTTMGTAELGTEPLENQGKIEDDVAQSYFDHIITDIGKNRSKEHVIFVGGGGHWATVVVRIINNRLYYIIADSTNEQRYGVDLKRKGIFITKAIQKIIDSTQDSITELIKF